MRRKEKEISDEAGIKAIIAKTNVCRLGMVNGSKPYIVPLCFGYHDNVLYFHGSLKGQKIDFIRKNPNVCFEFDIVNQPVESENACDWSMQYQSVIGFGKAVLIESSDEKRKALSMIMAQYSEKQFQFPENMLKATAVIKVEIESMTGKHSGS
ncbi:MAG: pyridoxamine 5'-phosphate oxidase family protein [Deltaproteobacteria bacterium]|nr:MAG: pyridoxamine 5'-phosphate oxidase family protein [Deltaproteobacteria bacterium]